MAASALSGLITKDRSIPDLVNAQASPGAEALRNPGFDRFGALGPVDGHRHPNPLNPDVAENSGADIPLSPPWKPDLRG